MGEARVEVRSQIFVAHVQLKGPDLAVFGPHVEVEGAVEDRGGGLSGEPEAPRCGPAEAGQPQQRRDAAEADLFERGVERLRPGRGHDATGLDALRPAFQQEVLYAVRVADRN
ncbi:hypothetical protein SARU107417_10875 [Salinibacter ruber]